MVMSGTGTVSHYHTEEEVYLGEGGSRKRVGVSQTALVVVNIYVTLLILFSESWHEKFFYMFITSLDPSPHTLPPLILICSFTSSSLPPSFPFSIKA